MVYLLSVWTYFDNPEEVKELRQKAVIFGFSKLTAFSWEFPVLN
jgi:hypothetical protein